MNDATLPPRLPEDLNALLDSRQWIADPHADNTVATIVGDWHAGGWLAAAGLADSAAEATAAHGLKDRWDRIDAVNAALPSWDSNRAVAQWQADAAQRSIGIGDPLQDYLAVARTWPAWGDRERVARAEGMFMDYGALSVTMLFCASLPECYVVPDLAAVLHATGQLELRVEHRIRATGAMVFPVMMLGGLTAPDGAGIAQILKVRLIHAMVRNLILRGCPEQVAAALRADAASDGIIPALARIQSRDTMQHSLFVHGWHLKECALPNNQEELAYTLLTFSYVFLRGMRKLGIAFTPQQEADYLHAWNVAGYFLGIGEELMAHNMEDAARLFDTMQARGRADHARRPEAPDPRPLLGRALMTAMQSVILPGPLRAFPVLLTRRLIGSQSATDLGLNEHAGLVARALFVLLMTLVRGIDAVGRLFDADFSIARLITRVVGYRLLCTLLMDQTRELVVPATLRPAIKSLVAKWGRDDHAPGWVNALEDRLTTAGDWLPLRRR